MTKEQLQRIWDEELVYNWVGFSRIIGIIYSFTRRASPILYKLRDPRRMVKWISSLELKRCPYKLINGEINTFPWTIQTRFLVNSHCPRLDAALYNESVKNSDIIDNIDKYKWTNKPRKNNKRSNECTKASHHKRTTKRIYLRDLSKDHDWRTVK